MTSQPRRPLDQWIIGQHVNAAEHDYKIPADYDLDVWDLDVTVHDSTGAELTPDRFHVYRELSHKMMVLPADGVTYPVTVTLWPAAEKGCGKP